MRHTACQHSAVQ